MKMLKTLTAITLVGATLAAPLSMFADDAKPDAKAKPYTLETCSVSGEKLGEMGKPYVFVHEGREIKLCCKSCLKDFKKDPAKYVKKIETEEAKAAKKS
jgi:hypothetical protein